MNKMMLQREIYKKSAIEHSIQAFQKIAKIHLTDENAAYYVLSFTQCVADPQRTMDEFGNYVLAEAMRESGGLYD